MADVVDDDVCRAVQATWQAVPALVRLVPGGPVAGRLKSTQPGADVKASGLTAQVECVQGPRPNERYMQGGKELIRQDYRKVTVTLRGARADVVRGVAAVLGVFNRKLGVAYLGGAAFAFPSGARFVRWWPLGDGEIKEDDATKAGRDVWQGLVIGEVWSVRTE